LADAPRTQQSPILIDTRATIEAHFTPDYFHIGYENRYLTVAPGGDNLAFARPYQAITFRSQRFELRKIHIHHPAEHLLDGRKPHAFECHLVHFRKGDDGTGPKVVIGVFFHKDEMAADCPSFGRIARAEAGTAPTVNPFHFLPTNRHRFFHYEGSLTSEPYREDVSWFVMEQEIPVSPGDTRVLEKYAEQDGRPVQPLNRRFVLRSFSV
jgi:carbonic anhydrase